MTRVCHVTSAHDSDDVRIFYKECTSLAKAGFETFIVAKGKSYVKNNVEIIGVRYIDKGRLHRMVCFTREVISKALEIQADVYHLHDPELLPFVPVIKRKGKKVIYDAHEDFHRDIYNKQWIPKGLRAITAMLFRKIEQYYAGKTDAVISVTPQITSRFEKLGMKTRLITNFPTLLSETPSYKPKTRHPILCYTGTIDKSRLHHTIINAIADIDAIEYVLAGPISQEYLAQLTKLDGFNKVTYHGYISPNKVQEILKDASIGIVLEEENITNYGKEGSLGVVKLFEYMQFGLPVICNNFDMYKQIHKEYEFGICVDTIDINSIRAAINYILYNPDEAMKYSQNGQAAIREKYNWTSQEKVLLKLYGDLL